MLLPLRELCLAKLKSKNFQFREKTILEYRTPQDTTDRDPRLLAASVLKLDIFEKLYAQGVVSYLQTLSKYDDERDGLDDIDVSLNIPNLFDSYIEVDATLGALLPTSITSQKATLYWAPYIGIDLVRNFGRGLVLVFRNLLYIYSHEYEQADVAGTFYNERYGLSTQGFLYFPIYGPLSGILDANYYQSENYAGTQKTVRGFGGKAIFRLFKPLSIYTKYQTKDRVISNNNLFDKDNTIITIGTDYVF